MKKENNLSLDTPLSSENQEIPSDILGSYTGVPEDGDIPDQDADDL